MLSSSFDFDTPVERRGTLSRKWDKYKGQDIIPLWLADIDFRSPPAIIKALHERVEHGVFGYATIGPEELVEGSVLSLQNSYGWTIEPEWLVFMPGVVTGFNLARQAVGADQDDVMTVIPAYHPFLSAPKHSRRNLITAPLIIDGGRWTFDFHQLERVITQRTKLFIHCNPHNPTGRIFSRDELSALAEICEKHNMIICSDEIHCDLLLDQDKPHIPIATLGPNISNRTITLMAPSKTFNIAGLGISFAVISDRDLRQRYTEVLPIPGVIPIVNAMAYTAAIVAYRDKNCSEWLTALLSYLRNNREILAEAINGMPGLSMGHVEATFLAWIDARGTGLEDPWRFFEHVGVGLSDGRQFGGEPGYVRLNFGCTRSTLEQALDRMSQALKRHGAEDGITTSHRFFRGTHNQFLSRMIRAIFLWLMIHH